MGEFFDSMRAVPAPTVRTFSGHDATGTIVAVAMTEMVHGEEVARYVWAFDDEIGPLSEALARAGVTRAQRLGLLGDLYGPNGGKLFDVMRARMKASTWGEAMHIAGHKCLTSRLVGAPETRTIVEVRS